MIKFYKKQEFCTLHNKVVQKLCMNRGCTQAEQRGCEQCMRELHLHGPSDRAAVCMVHQKPVDKFCFDLDCKSEEQEGCSQCMEQQHKHQPSQLCGEHKLQISRLCLSNCEHSLAFGCHTCMSRYHNHKKQLILDINHFFKEYNYVVHLGNLQEEVLEEKNSFKDKIALYFKEMRRHFLGLLDRAESAVSCMITNYYLYENEPQLFPTIQSLNAGDYLRLKPKDLFKLYREMQAKKNFNFTLNEIKKHCEYLVILERVFTQFDKLFGVFGNSALFAEFASVPKPNSGLELIVRYIRNQQERWNLNSKIEDPKIMLPADYVVRENNAKVDIRREPAFEQRVRAKDERVDSKSQASSSVADEFNIYYSRGEECYRLKRLNEAMGYFNKALTLRPRDAKVLNSIGAVYYFKEQLTEALDCYEKALSLSPHYLNALNNKGNVLTDLGRYEDALSAYNSALLLNPFDTAAMNGMGSAYFGMGKSSESILWFNKAIDINPRYANALNNKGNTLFAMQNYQGAAECYQRAAEAQPLQPLYRQNLENALEKKRQL